MDEPDSAKLVKVEGRQVLFFIAADHESDDPAGEGLATFHRIVRSGGVEIDFETSGLTWEDAEKDLAAADEEAALKLLNAARKFLGAGGGTEAGQA